MPLARTFRPTLARFGETLTKFADEALHGLAIARGRVVACVGSRPKDAHERSIGARLAGRGSMTPELDRRAFLKLAGVTAIVAACGGASAGPSPSVSAKATGRISIYSALNESTNNQLFGAFTKATGVEAVSYTHLTLPTIYSV